MLGPIGGGGGGWLRPKGTATMALPAAQESSAAFGQKRKRDDADGPQPLRLKYKGHDGTPSADLYLTGVPGSFDNDALSNLFVEHGFAVQRARVIPDAWGTGYSAGMVQLGNQEEAAAAIETLTGFVVDAGPDTKRAFKGCKGSYGKSSKDAAGKGKWGASTDSWNTGGKGSSSKWWGGQYGKDSSSDWYGASEKGKGSWYGSADPWSGASNGKGKGKDSWNGPSKGGAKDSWFGAAEKGGKDGWAGGGKKGKGCKDGKGKGKGGPFTGIITVKYNGRDNIPSDNLFVQGLHPTIHEQSLKEIFAEQGFEVVKTRVLPDTRGEGRAAALVMLKSMEEAALAIETLSGKALQSGESAPAPTVRKALHVKYSGKDSEPSANVYMSNVPASINQDTLASMFTNAGCSVTRVKIMYDAWGTGYNATLIELGSQQEAAAAIEAFNGQYLQLNEETSELTLSTSPEYS